MDIHEEIRLLRTLCEQTDRDLNAQKALLDRMKQHRDQLNALAENERVYTDLLEEVDECMLSEARALEQLYRTMETSAGLLQYLEELRMTRLPVEEA